MLARYYDWLSWFQRVTSWIGQGGGYQSFTVHRLLTSADPKVAGADVVHERILGAAGPFDFLRRPLQAPRVVDAGCGLGGTIFYLHRRLGGAYDGLTLSSTQRARAEREAKRRGIAEACRFHLRSYDDDLQALAPEGADLIVAIESLAHSPEPAHSIANLARTLRRGGRLSSSTTCRTSDWPGTTTTSQASARGGVAGRSAAMPRFSPRCPAPVSLLKPTTT